MFIREPIRPKLRTEIVIPGSCGNIFNQLRRSREYVLNASYWVIRIDFGMTWKCAEYAIGLDMRDAGESRSIDECHAWNVPRKAITKQEVEFATTIWKVDIKAPSGRKSAAGV
jgi:hypothetical protein